jgi:hypothetical protein
MNTSEQINRLRLLWQEQEKQAAEQRAAVQREKLEKHRANLLAGSWKPECCCDQYLRAVLEMKPESLCENGKAGGKWW